MLTVGGRYDPPRDTVPRPDERLPADRVRGPIGPRRRDHWPKGEDTEVMSEPLPRSYPMDARIPRRPGSWPSPAAGSASPPGTRPT